MNNPVIGLTASHDIKTGSLSMNPLYPNAIRRFGGLPVILPLELSIKEYESLSRTLNGILFTGGPDVHPFQFGEETRTGCGEVSVLRDQAELALFHCMYGQKKPILGICRGVQLINIALGGTIYQDMSSQFHGDDTIAHRQPFPCTQACHRVELSPGTRLFSLAGSPVIEVNSMHHQAVKKPAAALTVNALARGGLIEGLEMDDYPFLIGVQWHPEYLAGSCDHADRLFQSFVDACRDSAEPCGSRA